jgi:hypothetical protein
MGVLARRLSHFWPDQHQLASERNSLRCPYCGNENPGDHRFCGMCGRPLVETRSEPTPTQAAREPEPSSPAPAYTGGLFNLGAPADKTRDLDYLLEDEEETRSSKGMVLLTLIALALVVGLGYLRFRNGGFPFLKSLTASSQPKPAAPSDSSSSPESSDQPNPVTNPGSAPSTATTDASAQPSITPVSPPAEASTAPAPGPSTATESSATTPASDSTTPAASSEKPESSKEDAAEKNPSPAAEVAPPPAPAKPKSVAKPAPPAPSKPTDPVIVGQNYLYGSKGFPQNCERGLHYVKPAADQSNPKAMITMGALYATGHCLSRDLPTAYRFFALALRRDPENAALRQNTERVWSQMTAEERKQAVRLTQ